MTIVEHLFELRHRLVVSVLALLVGALISFFFYNSILHLLMTPYRSIFHKQKFLTTDPLGGFAIRLKVAGYSGLFLASPVVMWQLWRFITPGLSNKEKRYAIPFVTASVLLFLVGAAVAIVTLRPALNFLGNVGGPSLDQYYDANKYLGLILLMIIAFGVAFEFPILLVFLELAGVVPSSRLRKWRRPAIVVIVVVAAVITPSQDPFSLFAMAIPMYIFYEASILVGRLMKK
jgi:sec-independent protein translocase protein TatC